MNLTFGSVCSGIEAASVAWHPLGWRAAWLAEIEPFPSAVLAHHYPDVPNLGDMKALPRRILTGEVPAPDVFCGGTPCQAFSVAGLRNSLNDERGNLSLTFCRIADAIDLVRVRAGLSPAVIFWENVPGVLSTRDNAFGSFLAGLAGEDEPLQPAGGRWTNAGCVLGPKRAVAWRTLDAQHFGLAQRRRRVFVVASARDGFDPAQVLFEWDGVRRDTAPRREAGEGVAGSVVARAGRNGGASNQDVDGGMLQVFGGNRTRGPIDVSPALLAQPGSGWKGDFESEAFITTHTLRGEGFDASEDGIGRGTPLVPLGLNARQDPDHWQDRTGPLDTDGGTQAVGVTIHSTAPTVQKVASYDETAQCLRARTPGNIDNSSTTVVQHAMQVRRLTPRECERLQGFPDDYTLIPWRGKPADHCPDGPRYKALGNSWAVPVVRWIGRRIDAALQR